MGILQDKIVLVTGGSRGIGRAIVMACATEGAHVAFTFKSAGVAAEDVLGSITALGRQGLALQSDAKDLAAAQQAVDAVVAKWGRIDVLVNNAAILHLQPLSTTPVDVFERVLKVNCVGPFLSVQACAPLMIESGGGSIVNIGSTDSISGVPTTGAYTASKFALRGLTKVVALEYGKHNIRCNIVCPGAGNPEMVTEFFANHGASVMSDVVSGRQRSVQPSPMNRPGRPVDVAPAALYFASDESSYCTGTELVVDGGTTAGRIEPGLPGGGTTTGYGYNQ